MRSLKSTARLRSRTPRDTDANDPAAERLTLRSALRRESVKKHVAAVHVSGKLTLLQRKLANVLLLNAYDDLLSHTRHRIDARTLCVMIGYNSNDMETLKHALRTLVETTAEWDILGDDGGVEWGVSALLASARLRGGVCEYAYSSALAEKLHDPKIFALINLSIQRNFSSGHALALYENCYRFVRISNTGWWDIDLFRKLMGVDDSAYYKNFKHLNAKIIKPAVTEVNEVSNITVTPEFLRQGRNVVQIRFTIREKTTGPTITQTDEPKLASVQARLTELGVSERLAAQWIGEHGPDRIAERLDFVTAESRRGTVQGSALGLLSAELRREAPTSGPVGETASASGEARRAPRSATKETRRERLTALRRAHRAACFDAVAALVERRDPVLRSADTTRFLDALDGEIERDDFRSRGWRSALNAAAIFAFWEKETGTALPRLEDVARECGFDAEEIADLLGE